jgi:hypothetical protein
LNRISLKDRAAIIKQIDYVALVSNIKFMSKTHLWRNLMKFNWKALVAAVIVAAVLFLGINALLSKSYSGANLNFGVGSGPITVTNPSDQALSVLLSSPRSSAFSVTSEVEGLAGRSERQGTGSTSTQLYAFQLPVGVSEFMVKGSDVSFVAAGETILSALVQPVTSSEMRTILIIMAVVILGALFYISQSMEHRWYYAMRGQTAAAVAMPIPTTEMNGGQGPTIRTYGDNRTKTPNNQ